MNMRLLVHVLTGAALCLPHGTPPQLSLRVAPLTLAVPGDTVRISYAVTNQPSSIGSLFIFIVDAPAAPLRVEEPAPSTQWYVRDRFVERPVASWSFIEQQLAPGATSPSLTYSAVGLPGLVKYWGVPYVPPDSVGMADDAAAAPDSTTSAGPGRISSDSGFTVGIVPFPADRSPGALSQRLAGLIDEACLRGLVDNQGVCNSLNAKVRAGQYRALINELDAQRGKHVSEPGYFLLWGNAQILLR